MNVVAFGAHPDDCDVYAGGTAILWASHGHRVRFVSLTDGGAGHHQQTPGRLVERRRAEAREAGRRAGVDYVVLDHPDARLQATLAVRDDVIRLVRTWNADLVLGHRPNDYHPDHRATGDLLQDAAFLVTVPLVVPDTPPLRQNPVFLYFQDDFQKPVPFTPDVAVDVDAVVTSKLAMMDAHVSQFHEWLPWLDGGREVPPTDEAARLEWLARRWLPPPTPRVRAALARRYGPDRAGSVRYAEAFEVCEYGSRPDATALAELFPF